MKSIYEPDNNSFHWVILGHLIGVYFVTMGGLFLYPPTWSRLILCVICLYVIVCTGSSIVYHRCLTHKAFKFRHRWIERFFTTLGCLTLQRGPLWWCSIHRLHHRYSDTDQDPHNSKQGFWYSHVMWLAHVDPRWRWGSKYRNYESIVPDLAADPYYRWLDYYFYVPWLVYLLILAMIGGWGWLVWGGLIPTILNHHLTWFVNSASHKWGYKSYRTKPASDDSRNNWWVGYFAVGEGWHNNHHAFPSSPKLGFFRWWEFDFGFLIIWTLERMGIITELRYPTLSQLKASEVKPAVHSPFRNHEYQESRST